MERDATPEPARFPTKANAEVFIHTTNVVATPVVSHGRHGSAWIALVLYQGAFYGVVDAERMVRLPGW
jgi:hypothetical protein